MAARVARGLGLCLSLIGSAVALTAGVSSAAQTTGGVTWIDTLQYEKPQFLPLTVPDEATCPNKYYVNMSGGSGSTCSQAAPCAGLGNVAGKAGTAGGPAYVYVKGSGQFALGGTFYGSAGSEIVIKPWPGDSTVVTFQAPGASQPNYFDSANVHHVIVDGGPLLQFDFIGAGTDQNQSRAMLLNSSNITVARSRLRAHNAYGATIGIASYADVSNIRIVNNEFYDSNNVTAVNSNVHIYLGQCACNGSCSSFQNVSIQNNIFRDAGTEGIESNPRKPSDNLLIEGNAFHNLGKLSCNNTTWYCRPAIVFTDSCGGQLTNHVVKNNLIWDIGGGGIWNDPTSTSYIYHNTIYSYGLGTGVGVLPNRKYGINSYSNGYSSVVKNNIIFSPTGISPLYGSSGYTTANNLCTTGASCATTAQQTDSAANIFLSTDPASVNFLKPGSASKAVDLGANVSVATAYNGLGRPQGSGYDIGAYEYGSGGATDTTPPTVPLALVAAPVSSSRIDLSWGASTDNVGVAGYRVYRNGALAGTASGLSYQDLSLPAGSYTYTVLAYDAAGNQSAATNPVVAATLPDTVAPTTPGGVTATAQSSSSILVAWSASSDGVGVAGYRVYRNGTLAGTASGLSYLNTGLAAGTSYTYTVAAYDAAGNQSAASNPAVAATLSADAQAPTTPGGVSATAQSSTSILVAWSAASDNVGVTGYRVYRNGALAGTPSGLTYQDTGLAAGTSYGYTVVAYDAAGNQSAASNTATAATPSADAQAPTTPGGVSATAQSSTSILVAWSAASDNVGVTGYRVYRGGTLIATVAALSFSDAGLTPDTSYSYTVTAVDAQGNASAASSTATARTPAISQVDLVAAYGFNEGSGTLTADQSGNGNTGTLSGATWTASGKFGAALTFNGTSSTVSVADASLLRLTSGMTLEAWVYPTSLSSWRNIMIKEQASQLVYALYANNDANHPTGHVYTAADNQIDGISQLPLNAWSHLAATYDGSMLRLYVNGAEVSSRAVSGGLQSSTNPLRIGGNAVWGEYFNGRIDEVRVYRRALSAAEVSADMNAPVTSADMTSPLAPKNLQTR